MKGLTAIKKDLIKNLSDAMFPNSKAIVSLDFEDRCALLGNLWEFDTQVSLAPDAEALFLLDLSSVPQDIDILINPVRVQSEQSNVTIKIYEGTDYTGSVIFESLNYNRLITRSSSFTAYVEPTGSTKGNLITDHIIFASVGGQGSNSFSIGGIGGSEKRTLADKSKKYLLEIKNVGTNTTIAEIHSQIIEFCLNGDI